MRQQCIAAVHAKVLRLSGSSMATLGTGHAIGLISSDVRRFDDAATLWYFLIFAPLELGAVLLVSGAANWGAARLA